mgnify:CR=1 FL=1
MFVVVVGGVVEMVGKKVGFWMRDFHVLQTAVHVTMDFIGRRTKTLVTISGGRESNVDKLSDIASFNLEKQ